MAEYGSQYYPFSYICIISIINQAKEFSEAKQKLAQSKRRIDGHKKVKVDISFMAAGLISIPDEKELLHLMDEMA